MTSEHGSGQVVKPRATLPATIFLSSWRCLIKTVFGDARRMAVWTFRPWGPWGHLNFRTVSQHLSSLVMCWILTLKLRYHPPSSVSSEIQTGNHRKSQTEGQHPGTHIEPKTLALSLRNDKLHAVLPLTQRSLPQSIPRHVGHEGWGDIGTRSGI